MNSSVHIPILKYPIFFALDLEELKLKQMYQPLEDSFITSLISWNPLQSLALFHLTNGTHLTLMAARNLLEESIYKEILIDLLDYISVMCKAKTDWTLAILGKGAD